VAVALVPLPVAASDAKPAPKAKTIQASMQEMVARDVAAAPARTAARRAEQGSQSKESVGFFKTKPGMIALAVMIGGVGYALYSSQHDRITSAGKK
jgi:predicted methyltransferase